MLSTSQAGQEMELGKGYGAPQPVKPTEGGVFCSDNLVS